MAPELSSSLPERVDALRTHPLPEEWVDKIFAAKPGDSSFLDDVPAEQWVTLMLLVAYRHGQLGLAGGDLPNTFAQSIKATIEHLEQAYPGLLDAPAAVHAAADLFQPIGGNETSDQPSSELYMDTPDDHAEVDASWYGLSRVSSVLMVILSPTGEAIPSLQLRLLDSTKREFLNRMLPFGDALFLAISLIGNVADAFERGQLAVDKGTISEMQKSLISDLAGEAQAQVLRLQNHMGSRASQEPAV
ncbi:hypothetical protein ACYJW8_13595 [Frateuria aurantia]